MRRMFQLVVIITMVGLAAEAQAQTGQVEFDFPGAAAVEAGMSDIKRVVPDEQGRRRAVIVVPSGDQGTVFAHTRADGTTVVRLVSDGQPEPGGAFRSIGRYRDGDRLTFYVATLRMHQRFDLEFGARLAGGTGSLLGVVKKNCAEIQNELDLTCTGSDRGLVSRFGLNARWRMNESLDATVRVDYTKPSDISITANGTIGGEIPVTGAARASGHIWSVGAELGVTARPKLRLYAGLGLTPFSFDSEQSLTAFNQTERVTQSNTGLGRGLYGGVEFALTPRISLFGEGGRSWLKDTSVGPDDEAFDEAFSAVVFGLYYTFAALRLR